MIDLFREKAGELDLEQSLQSSLGGYTKKSVLEYIAALNRRQQAAAETFNRNLQSTLDEKETLQKENEALRTRLNKADTDLRALQESMASFRLAGDDACTAQDMIQLKGSLTALEKDMDEAVARIRADEQELEHREKAIADRDRDLEKSAQELKMVRELLGSARAENEGLRRTVSSQAANLSQLQKETAYLRGIVSDGSVAELNNRIDALMETVRQQQETIGARDTELKQHGEQIALLSGQSEAGRKTAEGLRASLELLTEQNEKLEAANRTLSSRLNRELRRNVEMLGAQSDLRVEKAVLLRKLDAARLQGELAANAAGGNSFSPAEPQAAAPAPPEGE